MQSRLVPTHNIRSLMQTLCPSRENPSPQPRYRPSAALTWRQVSETASFLGPCVYRSRSACLYCTDGKQQSRGGQEGFSWQLVSSDSANTDRALFLIILHSTRSFSYCGAFKYRPFGKLVGSNWTVGFYLLFSKCFPASSQKHTQVSGRFHNLKVSGRT